MANDRVYIKCKSCGGWKMLLKYYPNTGSTSRDNDILEWLDDHAVCHPKLGEPTLGRDPGFTLHTEDNHGALLPEKQNQIPKKEKTK
jgi:hypothetical protein